MLRIRIRDPGSGGFGIRNRFFPDPGSQTHILESLVTIFWVKSSVILRKLAQIFFQHFKNKIIFSFVKFVATRKGMTTNYFSPLSFDVVFWIRDLGSEIRDPGWVKIRIRDLG